ncbi:ankyrin repeat domain-containing protein [Orientia tsutsugamushi]|uniref:Ankyrin repeat-containing protein 17 n=1 Tax=Orientia tsutsugamushi TaxID=784 RepID=A0A2U3R3H9_ORITS|nr:ankyrin repeat domain-containing protein [Orientia tsutsugamushi]KJV69919.1 ankyrin repeat family protein [Orientia tsutsugamushi str. UT76]SPR07773.1 ankyrin repeat-containing protein 17 [Orientia tsutsugamushi]
MNRLNRLDKLNQLAKNNELTEINLQEFTEEINSSCDKSFHALHRSIIHGNLNIIKLLINKGVSPNIQVGGIHALHWAVITDELEIAEILIDAGADVNQQDCHKTTPLHLAIRNPDIVKLLIGKGANLNIQDNEKKTAYDLAAENNCIDAANIIREELTQSVIKTYEDRLILANELPSVALNLKESKLFGLNTYALEEILKYLNFNDLQSLKEACMVKLYTESNYNTDMLAMGGELSIDDNNA